jgi:hypothetical protein
MFGPVASDPTVSRLITTLAGDVEAALAALTAARASARDWVWQLMGAPTQAGRLVIDLGARLVTAHSDKQDATRTWKTFGFIPCSATSTTAPVGPGSRSRSEGGLEHRR